MGATARAGHHSGRSSGSPARTSATRLAALPAVAPAVLVATLLVACGTTATPTPTGLSPGATATGAATGAPSTTAVESQLQLSPDESPTPASPSEDPAVQAQAQRPWYLDGAGAYPARDAAPGSGASPAPDWLGTRVLGEVDQRIPPQQTPPELRDRRIATIDRLPPPASETFAPQVSEVPPDVLALSTWRPECPVAASDLRYVRVQFWGFDGLLHTGELVLNADAVDAVLGAFEVMFQTRFPLERVGITRPGDLVAGPTGDDNGTGAFSCRAVTGGSGWSQHAYGRAIDINPFHNPYDTGPLLERRVIPELATAYTDRGDVRPGMLTPDSPVVAAFKRAGWSWGGDYRSLKDYMHFSASGG